MSRSKQSWLIHYRYDPLDKVASHSMPDAPELQRFYCKNRLTTELQGGVGHTIFQLENLLLAQQRHENDALDTTLLATDLQRSALQSLKPNQQHPITYSPYGHSCVQSYRSSLLGFNGERRDSKTGHYLLGNGYRTFNTVLMRFNSPDTFSPFGRGGLNAYAYCQGDPINFTDPSGHFLTATLKLFRHHADSINRTIVKANRNKDIGRVKLKLIQAIKHERSLPRNLAEAQVKMLFEKYPLKSQPHKPASLQDLAATELPLEQFSTHPVSRITGSDIERATFLKELSLGKPINQWTDPTIEHRLTLHYKALGGNTEIGNFRPSQHAYDTYSDMTNLAYHFKSSGTSRKIALLENMALDADVRRVRSGRPAPQ